MEHTKGIMEIKYDDQCYIEFWIDGKMLFHTPAYPESYKIEVAERAANASRLVQCWNEHDDLIEQRDTLLVAWRSTFFRK